MNGSVLVVTGGAGFIGKHLVRSLGNQWPDAYLIIVDTLETGNAAGLDDFQGDLLVDDVASPRITRMLVRHRPKVIVHLASITDTTVGDQRYMLQRNVEGFRQVLEVARRTGARLVYASSAAVYGNGAVPMREEQRRQPHNVYGVSKLIMENLASHYEHTYGVPSLGLRYFNVYGPGEDHKGRAASMVYQTYLALRASAPVQLYKYGEQRRDFVHVEDAVSATVLAVSSGATAVVNVGSGASPSFNEVVTTIADLVGSESPRIEYIDLPPWEYQSSTEANLDRATQVLGYRPRYGFRAGVEAYVHALGHHAVPWEAVGEGKPLR